MHTGTRVSDGGSIGAVFTLDQGASVEGRQIIIVVDGALGKIALAWWGKKPN